MSRPISFTGTPVAAGDLVVADGDGVLVIPAAHRHTLAQSEAVRCQGSPDDGEALTQGQSTLELMNLTSFEQAC
ncbi:MAG: hypothetical protein MZV65_13970 [Chromatiales bacterium]|nr:hypothetical protein [Chromatiales bacterium]